MRVKVLNVETQSEVREISLEDSTARTGECLIGRSPDLGLVLESPDVSRVHGKFVNQDGQYTYYDLGSANGSLVNGKLAVANQPYALKPNDIVRIGEFTLMLREVRPMPEALPPTVMSSADATVVGSAWQFSQFSTIPTEEPVPQVPDDIPEAVPLAALSEEPIDFVSEEAVEPSVTATANGIDTVSANFSTPTAEPVEAEVDPALMAALTAISGRTETPAPNTAENEIVDQATTDWETTPLGTEPAPTASAESDEPELPLPAAAVEATSEPTVSLDSEATVIQSADLFEPNALAVDSEPTVLQTSETVEFADSEATVIQSADLIEATSEQTELELPDSAIAPSTAEVPESEPTVIQSEEFIGATSSSEAMAASLTAPEPDATVLQGAIAAPVEVPPASNLATEFSDVWSEPDTAADTVLQPPLEPVFEPVDESIAEPAVESGIESKIESDAKLSSTPIGNLVSEPVIAPVAEPDEPADEPSAEIPTPIDSAPAEPDSEAPVSGESQPSPFSDRYIALLCHDSQLTEMTNFVERHRDFLSQCLTISTPPISQALAAVGLQVSQQTPAVPPGGYQTVNSLVTSDKVLAVIFLRDFFTPQTTQANDEALTRSCNVNQVLLANNLPTAEAIAHYLENVLAGSVAL